MSVASVILHWLAAHLWTVLILFLLTVGVFVAARAPRESVDRRRKRRERGRLPVVFLCLSRECKQIRLDCGRSQSLLQGAISTS